MANSCLLTARHFFYRFFSIRYPKSAIRNFLFPLRLAFGRGWVGAAFKTAPPTQSHYGDPDWPIGDKLSGIFSDLPVKPAT